MNKKTIKAIIRFFAYFCALILILVALTLGWIATGPRNLPYLTQYLNDKINSSLSSNLQVDVGEIQAKFDDQYHLALSAVNIRIIDNGNPKLILKDVLIHIDPIGFFPQTNRSILNFQLSQPEIIYGNSQQSDKLDVIPLNVINQYINDNRDLILKFSLSLKNTSLSFKPKDDLVSKVDINVLDIRPVLKKKKIIFNIHADFNARGQNSTFDATVDTSSNKDLIFKGEAKNISNDTFKEFGFDPDILDKSSIVFNAKFNALVRGVRNFDYIDFEIKSKRGLLRENEFINRDVMIDDFVIKGYCNTNCTNMVIDKYKLNVANLKASGSMEYKGDEGVRESINIKFATEKLAVSDIDFLWPKSAIPRTRDWIFSHVTKGDVESINGNFLFYVDELRQKKLEQSDLSVDLVLKDAEIFYIDDVPPIEKASGHLTIGKDLIKLWLENGEIYNVALSNGYGEILDLIAKDSTMKINIDATGDLAQMIDLAFMHTNNKIPMNAKFKGATTAKVSLDFPLTDDPITLGDMNLKVDANVANAKITEIMGDAFIDSTDFKVKLDKLNLDVKGKGKLENKIPITINGSGNIEKNTYQFNAKTSIEAQELSNFGIDLNGILSKNLDVNLEYILESTKIRSKFYIDLINAKITLPKININKEQGTPGNLQLDITSNKGGIEIDDYTLQIPNLYSKGNIKLTNAMDLTALTSAQTKLYNGEFKAEYHVDRGAKSLNISGKSFDFSSFPLFDSFKKQQAIALPHEDRGKSHDSLTIKFNVDSALFRKEIVYHPKEFIITQKEAELSNIKLDGLFANNAFLKVNYAKDGFSVKSSDAGMTLKALGISGKINGGNLNVNARAKDVITSGKVEITNYRLLKTPVLVKLLSIFSVLNVDFFNSIFNIIDTEGMKFDILSCPFTIQNSVIYLENCKMDGPSLALSVKGTIDLANDKVKMKGVIISRDIISSAISSIPLIGKLLAGKNGGLIGSSFSVKGTVDNPEVSSNPLSVFAPGDLKELF